MRIPSASERRYTRTVIIPVPCDSCGLTNDIPVQLAQSREPFVLMPGRCLCGAPVASAELRDDLIDTALHLVQDGRA